MLVGSGLTTPDYFVSLVFIAGARLISPLVAFLDRCSDAEYSDKKHQKSTVLS
jgi:hypothetical protein